ncbi:MAG: MBL fold metallo-hydrolase [Thermodesulfobacteriota bacterium]|nr:MBL fold metallo-hydrolase [Thermodesulfobacteriota bacterium]
MLVSPLKDTMGKDKDQDREENIKLNFWGVRGTLPVPGHNTVRYGGNTSCVSVEFPNDAFFIFDAGTGIKELSNNLISERSTPVTATIFISHPHWDHINGLPFFAPLYEKGNRFKICGPPNKKKSRRKLISGQMDGIYFPINIKESYAALSFCNLGEKTFDINTIDVRTMFLNHPGQCLGYRLCYRNKSICYITDNEIYPKSNKHYNEDYVSRLTNFVSDADALITDCTYTDEEYKEKTGWGHSSVSQVVNLADRAGVKTLYLFHHDPDQSDNDIDSKLMTAQTILNKKDSSTACIAPKDGESFNI